MIASGAVAPDPRERRLAVLGSPIGHSKSPVLHRAAYDLLGLPWRYDAIEVGPGELGRFTASRGGEWRGLSLTMPLKREVLPLLDWAHPLVARVGAANTVVFENGTLRGFNTDVHGVIGALGDAGITDPEIVQILGAGASAASVIAAAAGLGAREVVVIARSPQQRDGLQQLATGLGIRFRGADFAPAVRGAGWLTLLGETVPDAVVSTLPGGTVLASSFDPMFQRAVPLIDIAYDPWPSALAKSWLDAGGVAHSGLGMLLHQAVMQVRLFVNGDLDTAFPRADAVLAVMRSALAADGAERGPA